MSSKPFSPSMNAACNLLAADFQRAINQLLTEEAASLGLPEGWSADVQQRVWVTPDVDTAPALVKD